MNIQLSNTSLYPDRGSLGTLGFWLCVLLGIFYGLMSGLTPLQMDDLHFYIRPFRDYAVGEPNAGLSWNDYKEFILVHYIDHNGRLANLIAPVFVAITPRWVLATLTGLAMGWATWLTATIASGSRRPSAILVTVIAFVYMFLLPWHVGAIFGVAYTISYLWPTAMGIWLGYLFLYQNKERHSLGRWVGAIILAFLIGCIHEGFSLPLLCGMGLIILLGLIRKAVSGYQWTLFIVCIVGTLVPVCSPGIWMRAEGSSTVSDASLLILLLELSPLILAVGALILATFSRPWRNAIQRNWEVLTFCGAVVAGSLFMYLRFYSGGRVFWIGDIFCILALAFILHNTPWRWVNFTWLRVSINIIAWAIMSIHMVTCVIWQAKISHQYNDVIERFRHAKDGIVYEDAIRLSDVPTICNRKISYRVLGTQWQQECISRVYGDGKIFSLLPTTFRDFDLNKAKPLNPHFWIYDGYLITDSPQSERAVSSRQEQYVEMTNTKGASTGMGAITYPFTDANGKKLYLLYPTYCYSMPQKDIKSAALRPLDPGYEDTTRLKYKYFVQYRSIPEYR